jgi:protein-S-isoprenylcysteine O-methyltransferase Ste14
MALACEAHQLRSPVPRIVDELHEPLGREFVRQPPDHLLPLPFPISRIGPAHWISAVIAGSLILIGIGIFAAGIRNFSSAATPVQGTKPTRALVTTGIHGWSRNPIYLGMFLVYGGIGIAVRSPWILILALPLAITMRYGVVAREEAYLERRFGDAYRDYKARVRRWL